MPRPERAPHDKTARFDAIYTPTTPKQIPPVPPFPRGFHLSRHLALLPPRAGSTFPALFLPYDTHFCRERWNRR